VNVLPPTLATAMLLGLAASTPSRALGFCGFFVGKADARLFNRASQVVVVHDQGKTVLTMVNDYRGEPKDFALVVPVPVVLSEDVVRVAEMGPIDHLDAYSAPRLAEYRDANPCFEKPRMKALGRTMASGVPSETASTVEDREADVRVEASFTVGEYDIVILSAQESNALETWLHRNGYNIPRGAGAALRPYVRSGMKFFVARIDLERLAARQAVKLRPLQFAFPDPRFMLPVRLGMLNADGPQDLVAYVITRRYRAQVANYRNVEMPSNVEIPTFVAEDFGPVYRAVFDRQVAEHQGRAVFTEYGWNMAGCDPCASPPLRPRELEALGVWWLDGRRSEAYVTRLHARYDAATFPEDLQLKITADATSFQVRYVLRRPFTQPVQCEAAPSYFASVHDRREREAAQLVALTGWDLPRVKARMTPLPPHYGHPAAPTYLERIRRWLQE
jgi:hypothetical protein